MAKEANQAELRESDVDPNPLVQFQRWYQEVLQAGIVEPTAMALATASSDGVPSARMVLLKGLDQRGFVFFTNYESPKGKDLAENPRAALLFWWGVFQRQIRISGTIERVSAAESDEYFRTRPVGSRLGAVASKQSTVLASRAALEQQVEKLRATYSDRNVPRPDWWGGYRIAPSVIEFWQGRQDRLHDRLRYTKKNDRWIIERLSP